MTLGGQPCLAQLGPWPKRKAGVIPTPATGPKVAMDAPAIFVVAGQQLAATSRPGGWDGLGEGCPKAPRHQLHHGPASFKRVNGSTVMCQRES